MNRSGRRPALAALSGPTSARKPIPLSRWLDARKQTDRTDRLSVKALDAQCAARWL